MLILILNIKNSILFFRGIRRRENQREGYRRALAKAEEDKTEFKIWHDEQRGKEAEITKKVNQKA